MDTPITTIDAIANIGITNRRPTSNAKNIIEAGTNKERIKRTKPGSVKKFAETIHMIISSYL